jgi:hypothetical protein
MIKDSYYKTSNPVILICILFVLMTVRVIYFYLQSDSILIQVIPDDAFYYLKLAKQKNIHGFWTFDGQSLTSGFHLLYAYLLYFLEIIFNNPSWKFIYLFISLISTLSITFSAYLISKVSYKYYGTHASVFSIIPFFSYPVFMQSTSMMESFLVILFSSFTIYSYCFFRYNYKNLLIFIIIGFLGSTSRTDFGLLPGLLFIFTFILFYFKKVSKTKLFSISSVLIGAIIGVVFVLIHNYYLTGQFSQGSALVKLHWSHLNGHDIFKPLIYLVLPIITPSTYNWIRFLFLIAFAIFFFQSFVVSKNNLNFNAFIKKYYISIASFFTLIGYVLFYRFNSSALQFWYVGNLVVPFCMIYAMIFHLIPKNKKIIYLFLFGNIIFLTSNTLKSSYPQQELIFKMSSSINDKTINGEIGAWNSGIMGYFTKQTIVNLDGLVNNDIYPYIKDNKLYDYINARELKYLVDFDFVLKTKSNRFSGGYDDNRMDDNTLEVFHLDDTLTQRIEYKKITLLKILNK